MRSVLSLRSTLSLSLCLTLALPAFARAAEMKKGLASIALTAEFVQPKALTEDFTRGYYATLRREIKGLPADASAWIDFLSRWNTFKAYY
jgi:hypothetical protein